jgi:hypothetical protein
MGDQVRLSFGVERILIARGTRLTPPGQLGLQFGDLGFPLTGLILPVVPTAPRVRRTIPKTQVRYSGRYSNKARGMRRKQVAAATAEPLAGSSSGEAPEAPARTSQTWAMRIKRVFQWTPWLVLSATAGCR